MFRPALEELDLVLAPDGQIVSGSLSGRPSSFPETEAFELIGGWIDSVGGVGEIQLSAYEGHWEYTLYLAKDRPPSVPKTYEAEVDWTYESSWIGNGWPCSLPVYRDPVLMVETMQHIESTQPFSVKRGCHGWGSSDEQSLTVNSLAFEYSAEAGAHNVSVSGVYSHYDGWDGSYNYFTRAITGANVWGGPGNWAIDLISDTGEVLARLALGIGLEQPQLAEPYEAEVDWAYESSWIGNGWPCSLPVYRDPVLLVDTMRHVESTQPFSVKRGCHGWGSSDEQSLTVNSLAFEYSKSLNDTDTFNVSVSGVYSHYDGWDGSHNYFTRTITDAKISGGPGNWAIDLISETGETLARLALLLQEPPRVAAYHDLELAIDDRGHTLVAALGDSGQDVSIFSKVDRKDRLHEGNVDVTSVNALLQDAGVPLPGPENVSGAEIAFQAVKITPDGNTVAIQQPAPGGGLRIDVVERSDSGEPWQVSDSFSIWSGPAVTNPIGEPVPLAQTAFAIGHRDPMSALPWRYLAYRSLEDQGTIVILRQTSVGQSWEEDARLAGHDDVSSIDFDYYAAHLAIGQPRESRVSIYQKDNVFTSWDAVKELNPTEQPGFGAKVEYNFGLLAISSDGAYRCAGPGGVWPIDCSAGTSEDPSIYTPGSIRIYRNADTNWGDYSDWTDLAPHSLANVPNHIINREGGPHIVMDVGGDAPMPVIVAGETRNIVEPNNADLAEFTIDGYRPVEGPVKQFL